MTKGHPWASFVRLAVVLVLVVVSAAVFAQNLSKPTAEQVERGRYLVTLGGCGDCHSPKKLTAQGPMEDEALLLSGHPASEPVPPAPTGVGAPGMWAAACSMSFTAWYGPWGISFASNLTPDEKTGLGAWTADQFVQAMRTGKHRGFGRQILPPMPWPNLAKLPDDDLKAIFAYLHSIKPINNQVPVPQPPAGH